MWKSPALRGTKADWQHVGPVFTSNATVLDDGFLSKEFVTIDYVGMLEGDPAPAKGTASGTRLFLNNVGGNGGGDGCCSGTTSYFPVMQAAPGAPLTQVAPQGMVDWGSFTFAEGSRIPGTRPPPPGATGVQLLSGMASRGLSMARTLGSEESDQVNKPGRRESNADRSFTGPCSVLHGLELNGHHGASTGVLIGWTGPADWQVQVVSQGIQGSAQSLPRDLSLAPDKSLLQQFVPELQVLRRRHLSGKTVAMAGLQAEVHARFPPSCATAGQACALRLDDYGELLLDHKRGLVTLDLTAGNNSAIRAGPMPAAFPGLGFAVHLYLDHQILELIVNNATAMVAYWSPPAAANASLKLAVQGDGAALDVWELASAHNNTSPL